MGLNRTADHHDRCDDSGSGARFPAAPGLVIGIDTERLAYARVRLAQMEATMADDATGAQYRDIFLFVAGMGAGAFLVALLYAFAMSGGLHMA
jgi:hypothetical protein